MYRLKLFIIAAATLLAAACSKDAVSEGYQKQYTYTAPQEMKV